MCVCVCVCVCVYVCVLSLKYFVKAHDFSAKDWICARYKLNRS